MSAEKKRTPDLIAIYRRHENKIRKKAKEISAPTDIYSIGELDGDLQKIVSGQERSSMLSVVAGSCLSAYKLYYRYSLLQNRPDPWPYLAMAGIGILLEFLCEITRNNYDRDDGAVCFGLAQGMAYLALTDRQKELRLFFDVFREYRNSPITQHFKKTDGPVFTFLFFLLAQWYSVDIDRSDSIFADPACMPESLTALAEWRTTDLQRVDAIVSGLADLHIRCSQRNTVPKCYLEPDFEGTAGDASFPYEILTWLRIREWAGLENPRHFTHPVMQGPQAVLPPRNLPRPEIPLLEEAMRKYHEDYPENNVLDRLLEIWDAS